MIFDQLEILPLIFILVFLTLIYILRVRLRDKTLEKWLGERKNFLRGLVSDKKRHLKFALQILALLFFIVALARPQILGEKVNLEQAGVYVALMTDVSQSMLAEDIKPHRLSLMKQTLSQFIDLSLGDQFALVAFASSAVLISPFTSDGQAIKSYLQDLNPDYFSHKGTHFARALHVVGQAFQGVQPKKHQAFVKVIVIASDGEDHSSPYREEIKKLVEQGVRVFTLSFGTQKGGVIPVKNNQEKVVEYKKDIQGNLVVSQLKSQDLKKMAQKGKGAYYHVTHGDQSVEKLRKQVDQLEKTIFETSSFVKKKEIYQYFLILGLILAWLEWILSDRKFFKRNKL